MNKIHIFLVLLLLFISGCVTTAEKKQAVSSVDRYWQSKNDVFMREHGHRLYPIDEQQVFQAVLSSFNQMNLVIISQDSRSGLVLGSAPAPLPLSAGEWQQVVDAESAALTRIVVDEVGFLGHRYQLDPVGKDTLVNVLVSKVAEGAEVRITFRLQTSQSMGEPMRTQAPPTAVTLGVGKFWRLLDEAIKHREQPRQEAVLTKTVVAENLTTTKQVCTSMADGEFSLNDARRQLMSLAKSEAVSEFFGEQIASRSEVRDFVLTSDQISAESKGIVRLRGAAKYFNGNSLGEVCMTADFYITESDLEKLNPQRLSEQDLCYAGEVSTIDRLRQDFPRVAISRVISRWHPQFADLNQTQMAGLARNLTIENEKVVSANVMCADVVFEVIPLEVEYYQRLYGSG